VMIGGRKEVSVGVYDTLGEIEWLGRAVGVIGEWVSCKSGGVVDLLITKELTHVDAGDDGER
jgi:hypothetical protein